MVALETRSLAKLQQRIAFEEAERLTFEDVSSRLQSLRSASSAFAADTLFSSLSATTSDQSILTVSATDAAPRGIHKLRSCKPR
jgi:flagellar capping protein FliD